MKKILIALDYDPSAKKVAESGYQLALSMNANVTLLHVMSGPAYYSVIQHIQIIGFAGHKDTTAIPSKDTIDPKKLSQEFLNKSKQYLGNDNIEVLAKEGDCAKLILETAKEINADLIIMGSHSRKWFENIAIGSVTEKVLMNTNMPVVIIPTKQR